VLIRTCRRERGEGQGAWRNIILKMERYDAINGACIIGSVIFGYSGVYLPFDLEIISWPAGNHSSDRSGVA